MIKKIIFTLFVFIGINCAFAGPAHYRPDKREHLPAALDNSYFGFSAGYTNIPYSNSDLSNNFQATSFTNPTFGLNVYIGHYFNRYIAAQISLMRPVKWAYANGIETPNDKHSIWVSLFGISARPTLPITHKLSLYGIAGLGIISRHGFNINGNTAISSQDMFTFLTGGGLAYALNKNWHLNVGAEYALDQKSQHQPHILYTYAGFYYLMTQRNLPKFYSSHYIFHKNLIQIGTFSTNVFNPNVNKYFTVGYLPIFWTGDVSAQNGGWMMYERNIFHTHKYFSFDIGVSAATYDSKINNTNFQTYSVFPVFRFWLLRSQLADFYFTYTLAGPSYITRQHIDNIDLGGHFTFQDLLGFGLFLGKDKHFNMNVKIGHYSNGNLLPTNPGVQIPLVFSVGYAF